VAPFPSTTERMVMRMSSSVDTAFWSPSDLWKNENLMISLGSYGNP
jgi:hypothetical protein